MTDQICPRCATPVRLVPAPMQPGRYRLVDAEGQRHNQACPRDRDAR